MEVAGLELALLLAVDDDAARPANGGDVDLRLANEIGADDVEMRSLGYPVAMQHRLAAARRSDHDVLATRGFIGASDGLDRAATERPHLRTERAAFLLAAQED